MTTPTITDPIKLAQVATLEKLISAMKIALYSGVTRVSYDGRSTDYASREDLQQRLALAQRELDSIVAPTKRRQTVTQGVFSNGYRTNAVMYGPYRGGF